MTKFQIVETRPTYCQITDGIIGNSYHRLPMTYCTRDYAECLSGLLHQRDYDRCGDNSYFVIEAGAPVLTRFGQPNRIPVPADASFDEVPF